VFVLLVPRGIVPSLGLLLEAAWRRVRRPRASPKPAAAAAPAPAADVPPPRALTTSEQTP